MWLSTTRRNTPQCSRSRQKDLQVLLSIPILSYTLLPPFFAYDASPVYIYFFSKYPNNYRSTHPSPSSPSHHKSKPPIFSIICTTFRLFPCQFILMFHASPTFPTALISTPHFHFPKRQDHHTLSYYYASPGHPPSVLPITPLANHSGNPLFHERSGKLLSYNSIARRLSKLAGKSASSAFRVDPCFEYRKEVLATVGR